jgi:hypothetical protein
MPPDFWVIVIILFLLVLALIVTRPTFIDWASTRLANRTRSTPPPPASPTPTTDHQGEPAINHQDPAVHVAYTAIDDLVNKEINSFLSQPGVPAALTIDDDRWLRGQIMAATMTQITRSRESRGSLRNLAEVEYQAIARAIYRRHGSRWAAGTT